MMVMTSQNATQNSTTYFWSLSGDSLYRHREELRLELYTPDNEALDSKIAKEIIEDYSGRFQEKINLLEEQYKSQATLCIRSSRSSVFFSNPARKDERARLAQCGVAQRQPQDMQSL